MCARWSYEQCSLINRNIFVPDRNLCKLSYQDWYWYQYPGTPVPLLISVPVLYSCTTPPEKPHPASACGLSLCSRKLWRWCFSCTRSIPRVCPSGRLSKAVARAAWSTTSCSAMTSSARPQQRARARAAVRAWRSSQPVQPARAEAHDRTSSSPLRPGPVFEVRPAAGQLVVVLSLRTRAVTALLHSPSPPAAKAYGHVGQWCSSQVLLVHTYLPSRLTTHRTTRILSPLTPPHPVMLHSSTARSAERACVPLPSSSTGSVSLPSSPLRS